MNKVLRLSTSLFHEDSVSEMLVDELLAGLGEAGGDQKVVQRDFRKSPVPHIDAALLQAIATPAAERSAEQQARVDYSDTLIDELRSADTLVIGLPMYNFSVPSMLKAWIDHIARAGVTFAYGKDGPRGLLRDTRVYLVTAMGGMHQPGTSDFLRPYMELIMGFIGLDDVTLISASGLNMGEQQRAAGLAAARAEIEKAVAVVRHGGQHTEEAAA